MLDPSRKVNHQPAKTMKVNNGKGGMSQRPVLTQLVALQNSRRLNRRRYQLDVSDDFDKKRFVYAVAVKVISPSAQQLPPCHDAPTINAFKVGYSFKPSHMVWWSIA